MDNSVMDNTVSDTNQQPAESLTQLQNEKMIPQSQLNEIVGNAKREAAEKAAARAVEDYKRQQTASQNVSQSHPEAQMSEDYFKRKTLEILDEQKSEWEKQQAEKYQVEYAQRVVDAYKNKIAAGKDKYQDFDSVVNDVDMREFTNVVQLLAEHVDNSADVLYHLAQRPADLDKFDEMYARRPQYAIKEMKRLSESIKANEAANQVKIPNAPLSQQRPSNTGTDSGALSLRDLKAKYKG
jgi:hypothetical protein